MLAKDGATGERELEDNGEGHEAHEQSWATLVDMGYQGSGEFMRTIQPKRKPRNDILSNEDVLRNKRVSSDRIVVEMYFGRLSKLWAIMADTYRWSHEKYDMIVNITCSLTNYHTSLTPLYAQDKDYYKSTLKAYIQRGMEATARRARNQAAYRRRRANRINLEIRSMSSQSTQSPPSRNAPIRQPRFAPY